jgi:hypothetical protein
LIPSQAGDHTELQIVRPDVAGADVQALAASGSLLVVIDTSKWREQGSSDAARFDAAPDVHAT